MAEEKKKTWKNSQHKWAYLRVAFIYFTRPSRVYEIAHKSRGATMREKMIRGRLIEYGVLSKEGNNTKIDSFDLENGHI